MGLLKYVKNIMEPQTRRIVCSTIIFNKNAQVLLGYKIKRSLWEAPGGKLDGFETIRECTERELTEETGLIPQHLIYIGYFDGLEKWLTHVFTCRILKEPRVMEPSKHNMWQWFDTDRLPPMTQGCTMAFKLHLQKAYDQVFRHP